MIWSTWFGNSFIAAKRFGSRADFELTFVDIFNLWSLSGLYFIRFLIEAPFSALAGVVADARDPPKVNLLPCHEQIMAGCKVNWLIDYHGNKVNINSVMTKKTIHDIENRMRLILVEQNILSATGYSKILFLDRSMYMTCTHVNLYFMPNGEF